MKTLSLLFATISLGLITLIFAQNISNPLGSLEQASIGARTCMADLGCFDITKDFFHPLYRPINFLPLDRASIDTQFHLYTKEHPMEYHTIRAKDVDSLKELDVNLKTMFIVHGFIDNKYYGKWMETLKDNILIYNSYNVIIVDWSKGNGLPYTKATANTRVVGAEIAFLIQSLIKHKGLDPMKVHIVGHSLGSHIAGYAGERLKKLGRITGLDPAAPYFQNMPPSVRLDPSDADFVDVIHTDSAAVSLLALGMSQACGHIDFYPNNGQKQPGCGMAAVYSIFLEGLVDATRRFVSCNHQRAVDFFTYSVNYKRALPVGFKCPTWSDFLSGRCGDCSHNRCAVMGIQADQYRPPTNDSELVKMYLATSHQAPFWEFTYHVTIKLFRPKSGFQDRKGTIGLKLQGNYGKYDVAFPSKDLVHGASYTYLVRQKDFLGDIKTLTFTWTTSSFTLFSKHTLYLEYVTIKPMNAADDIKQKSQTKKFCNNLRKPINSKESMTLTPCPT